METALKQFTEEQNNKTKKLLSDLNTKRRSRQRKSIVVVNTGIPPRNIVPKLNFNLANSEQINSASAENMSKTLPNTAPATNPTSNSILASTLVVSNENANNNTQQQQQNIIYSKPVAAVARQIVNSVATATSLADSASSSPKSASNSKSAVSNFQQMFNILFESNTNANNNTNNSNTQEIEVNANANANSDCLKSPPQTLNDMSLLDLSLNNNDSFLANLANGLINGGNDNNEAKNNETLTSQANVGSNSNDFISMMNNNNNNNGHKNDNSNNSIMSSIISSNNKKGAFSSVSADSSSSSSSLSDIKLDISNKICQSFSQILNENSNSTLTSKLLFSK